MDSAERSRALDLLGFTSQLVFSTFSLGLFAFSDDLDAVYGGASAHNRMMAAFCGDDPRRSEEHTSELQSLMRISYAVFCLKTKHNTPFSQHPTPSPYIHPPLTKTHLPTSIHI